jgi:TonB-linked SusC/RagA family outer membrane protein
MQKNLIWLFLQSRTFTRILLRISLTGFLLLIIISTILAKSETGSSRQTPDPAGTATDLQQLTVTGTIVDTRGVPIIGATVMVKGTTIGALTDATGKYTLPNVTRDAVMLFSFIGFTTQEVPLNGQSRLDVVLVETTTALEEVVVVGYGTQKKESVVGAITQVNNAALIKSGNLNVTNAIAGKLSGVLTIQQTGQPGSNQSEIIVRGLSSWNSSAPLVMVDGVERDFKDLDPNEINTISILKDASATAVFGAKGANGVIIVTTKRGVLGKPKLEFSSAYGMEKATRMPDHIDAYTTMSMLNVAMKNGQTFIEQLTPQNILEEYRNPSTPLNALRYPDVNWFDVVTKPFAPTANANLNIQGGSNFVKYFCMFGYNYQGDFFKAYNKGYQDSRYYFNRFNYRANLDFTLSKTTQLSLNLGGETGITNSPSSSPWGSLYQASVSEFPPYFPEWVLEQIPDPDYPDATGMRFAHNLGYRYGNPYSEMNSGSFRRYTDSKLFTDLIVEQKLDFLLKGLSVKGKASLSTYYRNLSLYADYSFPQYELNYSNIGTSSNPWFRVGQDDAVFKMNPLTINVGAMQGGYYKDLYYEMSLNYNNNFGRHNITALALINRQQKDYQTDFPYYNEALVGRVTYDYNHKYLIEVNMGYTGSERFAPGNRFGFFPSGAIGWVISEERFFKNAVQWMNKLKLRYSDGLVGSDYAASRWLYISDYYKDASGYIWEDNGANSFAQWEESRKRDIGVEIGLFKSLFTLSVDLFDENRYKMLLTPRSVTMLVGNGFKDLNLGKMKKHGIELELGYNKTTASGLNYFAKGIFAFNENRIIFKDDLAYAPDYEKDAGKPIGYQSNGVDVTGTGYYTSVNDIHNNVAPLAVEKLYVGDYKYLDYNGDGTVTSLDKHPIDGLFYPPITYSLSSGFSYKGFDFNFLFAGNIGKYVEFNQVWETEFNLGVYRVHATQLDYWRPDNQDATHANLHYTGQSNAEIYYWGGTGNADTGYDVMIRDRFWRNADYLRLKEVYAGYNFNSLFLERLAGISNLLVYATGNNLWTITKLIEGDPERKDFGTGFYPQMTSFQLGMKLGF